LEKNENDKLIGKSCPKGGMENFRKKPKGGNPVPRRVNKKVIREN